jgi:hypothetical protein
MNRRQLMFQMGSVLLLLPAARLVSACGGESPNPPGNSGADGGTGADGGSSTPLSFTSSDDGGHTHTVQLEMSLLTDSPAEGAQKTTSSNSGHTHTVALTEAELDSIQAGNTVTKATSQDSGHTHTFTFRKS